MISNPQPFSAMSRLFEVLEGILERRASRALTEKDNQSLREYLAKLLMTKRLHLVRTESQAAELWDEIRHSGEAVTDFVLQFTNELDIWLALSEVQFNQLQELMAQAFGHNRPLVGRNFQSGASAIDPDLAERLPTPAELLELYRGNPWLITLILLNMRGLGVLAFVPTITVRSGEKNP